MNDCKHLFDVYDVIRHSAGETDVCFCVFCGAAHPENPPPGPVGYYGAVEPQQCESCDGCGGWFVPTSLEVFCPSCREARP